MQGVCVCVVVLALQHSAVAQNDITTPQTALAIVEQYPQPQQSPINAYLDAIDQAGLEGGAYSMALADLYLGLGQSLLKEREYQRAKEAFQQAMQVERINNGLYSSAQVPYLFSIAQVDQQLGNFKAVSKALKTIYQINITLYEPEDPRRLPVLNQLLDWYMTSYHKRVIDADYGSLLVAAQLAAQIAAITELNSTLDHPDTLQGLRKVGHVNYLIVDHINTYGQPEDFGFTTSNSRSMAQNTFAERSSAYYRQGKYALTRVVEGVGMQAQSSPADNARALAELGDWYLVFGQRQSAAKTYQLAFERLQQDEHYPELQDELFGRPKAIGFTPPAPVFDQSNQAKISLAVSARGKARSIEVLESPVEMKSGQLRKLKKALRAKHFRPRLVNGQPEYTDNFVIYYPLER